MAPNKFTSLFLTATALLLLVAASNAETGPNGPISPFCHKSKDQFLCNRMVRDAKTWQEAMTNAISSVRNMVKKISKMEQQLESALANVEDAETQKSVIESCKEDMKKKLDSLGTALKAVRTSESGSIMGELISAGFTNCFVNLESVKNQGFDAESDYYNIVSFVEPGVSICKDIFFLRKN